MPTSRRLTAVFALCLALIPFIAGVGVPLAFGTDISQQYPISWSDEIMYWHQSASFAAVGFDAGQYSQYEQPASASFTPYYAWGPLIPAYYGSVGRLFHWSYHSIPLINAATLSLSLALFVIVARPTLGRFLLLLLLCGTFAPLLVYASSSMVELLQLAGAAVLAAALWPFATGEPPKRAAVPVLLVLIVLTLLRMSWAILIVPTMLFIYRPAGLRNSIAVALLAGIFMVILVTAAGWVNAPYQGGFGIPSALASDDRIQTVITVLALSIGRVLILATGTAAENLFLMAFGLTFVYIVGRARGRPDDRALWLFHAANLGLIFAALIALYRLDDWHGFRILGPHLFLTILLLSQTNGPRPLIVVAVLLALSTVLALPKIGRDFKLRSEPAVQQEIAVYASRFSDALRYDANPANRWCNSVSASVDYFGHEHPITMAIPAGFGLTNIIRSQAQTSPFKAKYLLISDGQRDALPMPQVRLITPVPGGALYENLQSACG